MQCRNLGRQVLLALQTSGLGALSCQGAGRAALRPTGTWPLSSKNTEAQRLCDSVTISCKAEWQRMPDSQFNVPWEIKTSALLSSSRMRHSGSAAALKELTPREHPAAPRSPAYRATVTVLVVTMEDKGGGWMLPPNQFVKQIIESWDQLELSNHPMDLCEEGREIVRP